MSIKRNITLLSWFNFFTDFVFFAPVAILYFAHVTGSYALGMSIFSLVYASSAIFEVPTGVASDLIGRKKTIVLGAVSSVLGTVLYAIGGSFWTLSLGALFQGLSRAFYSGNNDALLHDTLRQTGEEHQYHTHLGRVSAMFQFALAIAAIIGGVMASQSFTLVMWVSVLPQVCALLLATQLVEPSASSRKSTNIFAHIGESLKQFKQNNTLRLLTTASVLRFSLGESAFLLRAAFIQTLWPLWAIGIAYSFSHVGAGISSFYSGRIIDRFGPRNVLTIEILFNRVVNLSALLFPSVISPALMSSTSFLFGVGSVSMNSLLQKEFTQNQRATMSSLHALLGSIAFGICSVILGALADMWNLQIALIVTHVLLLLPLFFYQKIFKGNQAVVK